MNLFEPIRLAFLSLRTNKVRSFLTMLGIIIGVSSVILLVSIGTGLQEYVTNQFQSLGANSVYVMPGKVDLKNMQTMGESMLTSKLETTDVGDIERGSTLLSEVSPAVAAAGLITYRGKTISTEIAGVWENYFSIQNFTPLTGDLIRQTDVERSRKVIVLGDKPAKDLFGDTDPVGKWVTVGDIRYQVKGRLEEKGGGGAMGASMDDHAFIPYTTAMRQYNYTNPQMIVIKVVDQKSVEEASLDVKRVLLRRLKEDDFTVTQQTELLSTITQFLSVITVALGGIAAISLLVGGIGIMNIMLVSVAERTREIGVRKALGATRTTIMLQFLIEALALCLVGGVLGVLLGTGAAIALSRFLQWNTLISPLSVAIAFSFSAIIGLFFGIWPARRAARLDPIVALRYE